MKDYLKLRELLIEQNQFPTNFVVKFIGKNSSSFHSGVRAFESEHQSLKSVSKRESAKGTHLALTYNFTAPSADSIIEILQRVAQIADVEIVL